MTDARFQLGWSLVTVLCKAQIQLYVYKFQLCDVLTLPLNPVSRPGVNIRLDTTIRMKHSSIK